MHHTMYGLPESGKGQENEVVTEELSSKKVATFSCFEAMIHNMLQERMKA